MRSREFIIESQIEKVAALIKRDCAGFLGELPNPNVRIAWRGMQDKYESDAFGKHTARLTDRNPESTSKELHNRINEFFTDNFMHPFRNGVFVTGDQGTADSYAEPYAIFPIGMHKLLWHPKIDDMFTFLLEANPREGGKNIDPDAAMATLESMKGGFNTGEWSKAIRSGNEIMVWVQEYYYVHPNLMNRLMLK